MDICETNVHSECCRLTASSCRRTASSFLEGDRGSSHPRVPLELWGYGWSTCPCSYELRASTQALVKLIHVLSFWKVLGLWEVTQLVVAWLGVEQRPGSCSGRVKCRLKERRRDMVRQVHSLARLCPQPMSDTGQVPPACACISPSLTHKSSGRCELLKL